MKINRTDLNNGACNFCRRGKLEKSKTRFIYPYQEVTEVSTDGSGVSVNFCDECLEELKTATEKTDAIHNNVPE